MDNSLNIELLSLVAKALKEEPHALGGSKWGKAEAEHIATQAIAACMYNFNDNGDPFTWAGNGLASNHGMANNAEGLRRLVADGCIVVENYLGNLTPPSDVLQKDGEPQVLRITNCLLEYAKVHMKI